jgi:acyl-CoA dehydrogenase
MDFELTEEQRAIQRLACEFARNEIEPIAMRLDMASATENFPWELVKKGSELGFRTLTLPPEWGGIGADSITQLAVIDELAYVDASCSKIFAKNWTACRFIIAGGTEEQKERFLPLIRDNDTYLLATPGTEPGAGADKDTGYYDAPPGEGIMTSAKRKGDRYVINGRKHFISHGPTASLYILRARTDPSAPVSKGVSFILIPRNTPGVSVGAIHDKIGWRAYPQSEIILENVEVPVENLLGGKEGYLNPGVARGGRMIEVPAHQMAVARAALDAAVAYAGGRRQGGKIIIQHQSVAQDLADCYTLLEAGRTLLWRTAWADAHKGADRALTRATHVFCTEASQKICLTALHVFGGYGVMREMPIQKYLRDAITMGHGESTVRVQKLALAKLMESRFKSGIPLLG